MRRLVRQCSENFTSPQAELVLSALPGENLQMRPRHGSGAVCATVAWHPDEGSSDQFNPVDAQRLSRRHQEYSLTATRTRLSRRYREVESLDDPQSLRWQTYVIRTVSQWLTTGSTRN